MGTWLDPTTNIMNESLHLIAQRKYNHASSSAYDFVQFIHDICSWQYKNCMLMLVEKIIELICRCGSGEGDTPGAWVLWSISSTNTASQELLCNVRTAGERSPSAKSVLLSRTPGFCQHCQRIQHRELGRLNNKLWCNLTLQLIN